MPPPKKPKNVPPPGVVRRPREERKRLPPDIEALASGETDRLPPRARRPRLRDPRTVALVPGVANRDARAVYEARVSRLSAALAEGDEAELGAGLLEAVQLGLWRGRSVTGFDALAEQVLGLDAGRGRQLALSEAEARSVPCDRCREPTVAAWLRAEAALLEVGIAGRMRVRVEGDREQLELAVDGDHFAAATRAIGRRMEPLVADQRPVRRPPRDKP